jgi:hypothetical protein
MHDERIGRELDLRSVRLRNDQRIHSSAPETTHRTGLLKKKKRKPSMIKTVGIPSPMS